MAVTITEKVLWDGYDTLEERNIVREVEEMMLDGDTYYVYKTKYGMTGIRKDLVIDGVYVFDLRR